MFFPIPQPFEGTDIKYNVLVEQRLWSLFCHHYSEIGSVVPENTHTNKQVFLLYNINIDKNATVMIKVWKFFHAMS